MVTRIDCGWIIANTKNSFVDKNIVSGTLGEIEGLHLDITRWLDNTSLSIRLIFPDDFYGDSLYKSSNPSLELNHNIKTAEDLLKLCDLLGIKM